LTGAEVETEIIKIAEMIMIGSHLEMMMIAEIVTDIIMIEEMIMIASHSEV